MNWYIKSFCIFFYKSTVFGCISRIHNQKNKLKWVCTVLLQLLHTFGKYHRILTARNTNGNFIVFLYKLIFLHSGNKINPNCFAVFFYYAALNFNMFFKFSFSQNNLLKIKIRCRYIIPATD